MKRRSVQFLLFVLWVFFAGGPVVAADIRKAQKSECDLALSGDIQPGDAEALRRLGRPGDLLCLDSAGGSYSEGIAVANLVATTRMGTLVSRQASCHSACAIVFMAGRHTGRGTRSWRTLHVAGKLGFHAPFLGGSVLADRKYSKDELLTAYAVAVGEIARLLEISDFIGMPKTLIAEMLKRGKEELYMVETVDQVGRWAIDITGLRATAGTSDGDLATACLNSYEWREDRSSLFEFDNNLPARSRLHRRDEGGGLIRARFGQYGAEGSTSCTIHANSKGSELDGLWIGFSTDYGGTRDAAELLPVPPWYVYHPRTALSALPSN